MENNFNQIRLTSSSEKSEKQCEDDDQENNKEDVHTHRTGIPFRNEAKWEQQQDDEQEDDPDPNSSSKSGIRLRSTRWFPKNSLK